jgi:superfamily I DNA/RNA helicase
VARLGIDRDFLLEFAKLEAPVQRRVHEAFEKFGQATHAGAHLEKIGNVRDDRLRSIRIDQFWRGVVLAPETGDTYTLLIVLPHDEAYAWAQRRRFSVNRATGTIEIRDVAAIEEELPRLAEQARVEPARLLGHVKDADLIRLGVDEQVLPLARMLTDPEQLDALRAVLPGPQFDALFGLATGMTADEVWSEIADSVAPPGGYDPDDVVAAVERSPDRVVLVSGPDELMEVFAYPFALWRTYLHPSQHRVAYGTFGGPARVTGGPGTGKTVTALHRVRHLASASGPARSILLTTFTKTLVESLESDLRMLVEDQRRLERIDVRHVDQLANKVTTAAHGRLRLLSAAEEKEVWHRLVARHDLDATEAFLMQEWRQVVLAQEIGTEDAYLGAVRAGRGKPLGARQRGVIWPAMADFAAELTASHRWTHETVCVEAARLLSAGEEKPYRHVVVDEAQDLSPWQWRLLRAAVPVGPDDLFLAGDTHQRIYGNRVTLKKVGIDVAGRSARLTINYRTTAEILGWSLGLLRGEPIDDMDGMLETLAGCRSDVHGAPPLLVGVPSKAAEMDRLVGTVRGWLAAGVEPGQIGVAARSGALVDQAVAALDAAGLSALSIAKRPASDGEIPVATMHRMKGLEFRCMAVIGVSDYQMPAPSAVTPVDEDRTTHDLDVQRERCLLFVACTRAREELTVSWHGRPSALLPAEPADDRGSRRGGRSGSPTG